MIQNVAHTIIMTLVFPDSLSNTYPRTAPRVQEVHIPDNGSAKSIPSTGNALSPISQDTALAFSVPYSEASAFLSSIQELPNAESPMMPHVPNKTARQGFNGWVMKAAKNNGRPTRTSFRTSTRNAWTGFVDLLKVCRKPLWNPT